MNEETYSVLGWWVYIVEHLHLYICYVFFKVAYAYSATVLSLIYRKSDKEKNERHCFHI